MKVRACASRLRNTAGQSRRVNACRPIAAASKAIETAMSKPCACGRSSAIGFAVRHPHRPHNLNRLDRRVLLDDAGAVDQEHEIPRRAVQDGHLRSVDFEHGIVHAAPGKGRHDVFDRAHPRLGVAWQAEHGAQTGVEHVVESRRDVQTA